jgi:hypothetical protein
MRPLRVSEEALPGFNHRIAVVNLNSGFPETNPLIAGLGEQGRKKTRSTLPQKWHYAQPPTQPDASPFRLLTYSSHPGILLPRLGRAPEE